MTDLANRTDWLNTNKSFTKSLKKINNEPVILKHKKKKSECSIKIWLNDTHMEELALY